MCCCHKTLPLLRTAATLVIVTFLLHLTGYSAPYWSHTSTFRGGLWEVCQNGVCSSSLDFSLLSDQVWFKAVLVMETLAIVTATATIVLVFIQLFVVELSHNTVTLTAATVLSFSTTLFIATGNLVYGFNCSAFFVDQFESKFSLGFAFTVTALGAGGWLLVGIILLLYMKSMTSSANDDRSKSTARNQDPACKK